MANRLKGITLEIGGDTTELSKSLSAVNKDIKDTQAALKDVNKLLKLDPGNSDLLQQKYKLLADQIENTKGKLEELKNAQTVMDEKGVDKTSDEYMNLRREIVDTEISLKDLEKAFREANVEGQKIAAVGEKFEKAGENIEKIGKKVSVVSGAVTGLGAAAVTITSGFDSAMSKVAAVSGAAGDELDALKDKAREMGASTKFSASEAAEAMNYMAMAGWKTQDMLDGISGIMSLAAASGEDLATTSDIVTDALTAFGLSAEDSGKFSDVLAAAASNANTNVAMMGETFKYAASIAGAMGYSVEDTAEAIGLMANSGIKASQAGTSLRRIMTSLQGTLELSGDAFGQVQIETANADGSMREFAEILDELRFYFDQMTESEAANSAEMLVGKNALSGFLALLQASPDDVTKLRNAIADADGTASKMADTMLDNLGGQLQILKSQLEELAISFGEILVPMVRNIVKALQGFVDRLNNMDPGMRKVVVTVGLFVAALGPLLLIIGKTLIFFGQIMQYAPKLIGAFNLLKGALAGVGPILSTLGKSFVSFGKIALGAMKGVASFLLTNPIGLAIIAAVGVVAIFGDQIQDILGKLNDWLQGVFAKDWKEVFGPVLGGVFNGFLNVVKAVWNAIQRVLNGVIDFVRGVFTGNWRRAWEGVKSIFSGIFGLIPGIVSAVCQNITSLITNAFSFITSKISALQNTLSRFGSSIGRIFGSVGSYHSTGSIPAFATGGTLYRGTALVGEAGPELLTVAGGKATVTPLTATIDSRSLAALSGSSQPMSANVTINFTGDLAQLGKILNPVITAENNRLGTSLISY